MVKVPVQEAHARRQFEEVEGDGIGGDGVEAGTPTRIEAPAESFDGRGGPQEACGGGHGVEPCPAERVAGVVHLCAGR